MDDMRTLNGLMGRAIVEINNSSDEEIEQVSKLTFRDYAKAYASIPDRFADLPAAKTLMAFIEIPAKYDRPPETEEEEEQFVMEFLRTLGVDNLDEMTEADLDDLRSDMETLSEILSSFGSPES